MKAFELRIGNLVMCNLLTNTVDMLTSKGVGFDNMLTPEEQVEPIPLTEEWLLKFGWVWNKETKTYEKFPNGDARMHIVNNVFGGFDMFNYVLKATIKKRMNHVHQLQNLYFALTGEELKIN